MALSTLAFVSFLGLTHHSSAVSVDRGVFSLDFLFDDDSYPPNSLPFPNLTLFFVFMFSIFLAVPLFTIIQRVSIFHRGLPYPLLRFPVPGSCRLSSPFSFDSSGLFFFWAALGVGPLCALPPPRALLLPIGFVCSFGCFLLVFFFLSRHPAFVMLFSWAPYNLDPALVRPTDFP